MNDENNIDFLHTLEEVIESRKDARTDESYTAKLFANGPSRMAQKVGEEGVEVALASVVGTREDILCATADLIYHLLVLLNQHDLSFADVVAELEARHR
ncbi:MAG: phosphoribosyl-ATP diphosphatase [Gammaproteobacteria bacterium]|nr:phosphoribosyl-ATP diphosphatase [Gammaproteobacteria bacterium]